MTVRWQSPCSCLALIVLASYAAAGASPVTTRRATAAKWPATLQFERNVGQLGASVKFLARADRYRLYLTEEGALLNLGSATQQAVVRMRMLGASRMAAVEGLEPSPTHISYFRGSSPDPIHAPAFGRVTYRQVWPGIDITYYGTRSQLEYDTIVAPGADPRQIRFAVEGSTRPRIDDGDLLLKTPAGEIRWRRPSAYQEAGGQRIDVPVSYRIRGSEIGFQVASYDRTKSLTIDPLLVFSSYFGGSSFDFVSDIASDSTGAVYITGGSFSSDLPTKGASQGRGSDYDAFIAKFDSTGRNLLYATYYGGSGYDIGAAIAVDSETAVWIAGTTTSDNLPASATNSGFQTRRGGAYDAFLVKFDLTGSFLQYTSYLGGNLNETPYRIVVDSAKIAYVSGVSASTTGFPTGSATFQSTNKGGNDGFVARVNAAKSGSASLEYSALLGGTSDDSIRDCAVDTQGRVYCTGFTSTPATGVAAPFPITSTAYQTTYSAASDAFVTVLDTTVNGQASLIYSTYLGTMDQDYAYAIALDPSKKVVYVTGQTLSNAFPVVPATIADSRFKASNGSFDAFVSAIDTTVSGAAGLKFSYYLGSSGSDSGLSIVYSAQNGYLYLGGSTVPAGTGAQFPTSSDAFQKTNNGGAEVFVAVFNPADANVPGLAYSTLFGGSSDDYLGRIALDPAGSVYLGGYTTGASTSFPLKNSYQPIRVNNDPQDGFFAKFLMGCSYSIAPAVNSLTSPATASGSFQVTPSDQSCVWTATPSASGASWITVTQGATATTGTAIVTYNVAANAGVSRSAAIAISGSSLDIPGTHQVSQPGSVTCTFASATANPSAFSSGGGSGTLTVAGGTNAACIAAGVQGVSSNQSWVTLGTPDTSTGTIPFTVSLNTTASARQATINLPAAGLTVVITQQAYSGPPITGLAFYPLTPCRVADTRNATGTFGGPTLAAGTSRTFLVPQSACGIPSSAQAYSLNVTVVPKATQLGFLTLWPTGVTRPLVSTLNSPSGKILANAALVPAGTNGGVDVYSTDDTEVILDINGYFAPPGSSSALVFYPVTPCRIADTRNATGSYGGPILSGGTTRNFTVPAAGCGIPSTALAFSLNATVVPQAALGFLTLWPAGQTQPLVSTLNSPDGSIVANAAIVPAGSGGTVSAYVTDATHLVLDINGYFAPATTGGLYFYTATPCRVLDTRNATGTFGGPILDANSTRAYAVPASSCPVPSSAQAYSLNATVVPPAGLGYLTLWPTGGTLPLVSTLNSPKGLIVANAAIVPAGTSGSINSFVTDKTDLILDINGYFGQ
jgi:hypothetical protein